MFYKYIRVSRIAVKFEQGFRGNLILKSIKLCASYTPTHSAPIIRFTLALIKTHRKTSYWLDEIISFTRTKQREK